MPAYYLIDLTVSDPEKIKEYEEGVGAVLAKYGGRVLARSKDCVVIEGSWRPQELIILEFPGVKAIENFYHSADYAPLMQLRHSGAKTNALAVEGHVGG